MRQRRVIDTTILSYGGYVRDLKVCLDLRPAVTNSLTKNFVRRVLATASPDHKIFFSNVIEGYGWPDRSIACVYI
jgi:hypothetical protein